MTAPAEIGAPGLTFGDADHLFRMARYLSPHGNATQGTAHPNQRNAIARRGVKPAANTSRASGGMLSGEYRCSTLGRKKRSKNSFSCCPETFSREQQDLQDTRHTRVDPITWKVTVIMPARTRTAGRSYRVFSSRHRPYLICR